MYVKLYCVYYMYISWRRLHKFENSSDRLCIGWLVYGV